MASNVNLIDPNEINTTNMGNDNVNAIPQYQDMYIFAELKAKSKARTVIVTTNDGSVSQGTLKTGLEKPREVNLMGVNQNEGDNNPNYLKFTTNYYDGSTGSYTQYESFGISNIKIVVNSSYVPQVNIQFVDLRGLSFFNQEGSPYRILFDFPPPIFELSIKGYYGKTLRYLLHLVKYTSEFQSDTGNFVIDAQFVAMTFAPLSDVLFRYVVNGALMTNPQVAVSPSTEAAPANTFMLITQLKSLYTAVTDKVKTDNDSKEYDRTLLRLNEIDNMMSMLQGFRENPDLSALGTSYLVVKEATPSQWESFNSSDDAEENQPITQLDILSDYDEKIKAISTDAVPEKMEERLYIIVPVQYNFESLAPALSGKTITNQQYINNTKTAFEKYAKKLIENASNTLGIINTTLEPTISKAEFDNYYSVKDRTILEKTTKYVGIDITDFYLILYKEKFNSNKRRVDLSNILTTKINNMVFERLGMMPTIYNIFKIILDDVDIFFERLRTVSKKAENEHHINETNKRIILGDSYKDVTDKIYAFPLIVDTEKTVCGGNKEERVAPIRLSKKTLTPFPEMEFVDDFIQTFFTQARLNYLANMRENQNDDGTYEWIPISPFDSKLGTINANSPYYDVDSLTYRVNTSESSKLAQVLEIALKRFYVLSQSSISNDFYPTTTNKTVKLSEYVKMYATSEAINLALSVANSDYGDNIKSFADKYRQNVGEFYKELEKQVPTWYGFSDDTIIAISGVTGDEPAYVNKNNPEYLGINLYYDDLKKQTINQNSERPIDKFKAGVQKSGFAEFFSGRDKEVYYQFTEQNTLFILDKKIDKKGNDKSQNIFDADGNNIITRYLSSPTLFESMRYSNTPYMTYYDYPVLLSQGNKRFASLPTGTVKANLKRFESIVDVWSEQLSKRIYINNTSQYFDDLIYDDIIKTPSKLSALFILSNFGNTLGAFNKYPSDLNSLIFTTPAAIEVPRYLPLYLGALIDACEDNWIDDVIQYFTGGTGKYFYDRAILIFCDYSDVNKYLSTKDKAILRNAFLDYYNFGSNTGEYYLNLVRFQHLYDAVSGSTGNNKEKIYKSHLDPEDNANVTKYYGSVLRPLIERMNIIVFSQDTFEMSTDYPTAYKSIKSLNTNTSKKAVNDGYFTKFLNELFNQIENKKADTIKKENEDEKKKNDEDIITQTYYSFKNINDKWLTNPTNSKVWGYPFNRNDKRLIDSFVFVDRAMNPAGDTMLNAEILIELLDDPNISVYSVLSQLLSLNGFEFFPLQNFMIGQGAWEECFKIDTSGVIEDRPAFVCMYVGGSANYPTTVQNGFKNDGIEDLANTDVTDFSTEECSPDSKKDNQLAGNDEGEDKFPYRTVRAFKVRFGEQNQSMFTNIKIDSKEYPETNESIQILSRLAGDNKEHAIPKGQNLYNLYENRSYKATIMGLGNVMIQPTQYFQLENVPLFNGAYIILSVEHDITANKMTTTFSGTKILKYPVPRVKDPLAFMGYDGGESRMTSTRELSSGQLVAAAQATTMSKARLAQLNSVYGVDVSKWQGDLDWNALANPTYEDDPKPKFALIKVTQGTTIIDKKASKNANGAKAEGLKIGYYHYAQQYTGSDIVNDAKAQAQFFLNNIATLPKPDFPLVLDIEDNEPQNKLWGLIKTNNDLWINTFVSELKANGYDTILYSNKYFFQDKTSNNFGSIPLWHAQYLLTPEVSNPSIASGWNDWKIWQFSSQGKVNGYGGDVDINAMKESFYNKYA